jgi:predicted nucleic acid-binding protein
VTFVVVDASLAVKWVLLEEHSAEAAQFLVTWEERGVDLIAPSWFACEVSNVLFQQYRKGIVSAVQARSALTELLRLVSARDYEPAVAVRALEFATEFGLRATYDSQYLALAEHLDCELWTADARFWNATRSVFPRVRWIGEVTLEPDG